MTTLPSTAHIDALRAIIAAGVAAYQESLPDYARDETPRVIVPDHVLADVEPQAEIITLDEEAQRRLCLSCVLVDCVGVESEACPIRIEERCKEKAR
jgi:hypothetical protein